MMAVAENKTITEDDFQKFREFFYRKTGIHFDDSKRYFVDKRLVERMQATKSESFRSYFVMLRFQTTGEELQALINVMTVNETYFFREEYHFSCMVNSMLPEVVANKKPGDTVRIWSIPSSSGEEPYSIAIYLQEYWPDLEKFQVELMASDIDTTILNTARAGIFSERSVANIPANVTNKYFRKDKNGMFHLDEDTKSCVEFSRVNLAESADTRKFRKCDLIFCRNLLIYFDDVSRRIAAEAFFEALNPGGFICLGHSESMSRISGLFKVRKYPDAIVYQKP
ncbi:MAG: protein-glutamate O-methyltransferase CheR [Burkholderiales bacterium]|jgi:chemotaxis protein methyltransferase CheR|nr:protein-glutamate O-methyltransferase CheR [Burkholderiales bacterium]